MCGTSTSDDQTSGSFTDTGSHSIHVQVLFKNTEAWSAAMTSIHVSVPTAVWPLVYGYMMFLWQESGKWTGCDSANMNGLLWIIRIAAHTHTHTQPPLIQFRFISGADCVDYLMMGALDYCTLGISALSFLMVTLSAKHAGRLIDWARVILLWPSTGTNKGSINCTGPPYWTDSNHKIMWYLGHQCLSGDPKTIVAQDTVSVFRGGWG